MGVEIPIPECQKNYIFDQKKRRRAYHLKVTPPMYVPSKSDVRRTFAAGSVANDGNSCMYVATHVKTAAKPTKLQEINRNEVLWHFEAIKSRPHKIYEPVKRSN